MSVVSMQCQGVLTSTLCSDASGDRHRMVLSGSEEAKKQQFFELVEHLQASTDETQIKQIKEQLARMTFGV